MSRLEEQPIPLEESHPYRVGEISHETGLPRSRVAYLSRIGLVTPVRVFEGGKRVRRFSDSDFDLFRKASRMLIPGVTNPRSVVSLLRPEPTGNHFLLTENEQEVLRRRYLPEVPETLEDIGKELGGLARQTVHEIEQSGVRKIVRSFLVKLELDRENKGLSDGDVDSIMEHIRENQEYLSSHTPPGPHDTLLTYKPT